MELAENGVCKDCNCVWWLCIEEMVAEIMV